MIQGQIASRSAYRGKCSRLACGLLKGGLLRRNVVMRCRLCDAELLPSIRPDLHSQDGALELREVPSHDMRFLIRVTSDNRPAETLPAQYSHCSARQAASSQVCIQTHSNKIQTHDRPAYLSPPLNRILPFSELTAGNPYPKHD